jgi:hypothetical protein
MTSIDLQHINKEGDSLRYSESEALLFKRINCPLIKTLENICA